MPAPARSSAGPATVFAQPVRVLHKRYIVAQILLGYTNDAIRAMLEQEDLDEVDGVTLDRLRAGLRPPKRFATLSRRHRPSLAFLDSQGIRELVHETKEAEEALFVLRTPRARELVEVALIARVPASAILGQLRHQHVAISEPAIGLFEIGSGT